MVKYLIVLTILLQIYDLNCPTVFNEFPILDLIVFTVVCICANDGYGMLYVFSLSLRDLRKVSIIWEGF